MEETKKSGFATAGLVLGIIGVCTSFIPIINNLSFIMGVLAIVFGIVAFLAKARNGKTVACIVLGIITIVMTYYSQKAVADTINDAVNTFNDEMDSAVSEFNNEMDTMTGENTEEILKNNLEVALGEFTVVNNGYFTETSLKATITNKSTETKSFSVQVEAVDGSGARIETDYIYANNLTAGQSQDFEIFNFVASDKVNTLKNATFKIVEVSMY